MVKTGAKKPNFKLPGRNNGNKKGLKVVVRDDLTLVVVEKETKKLTLWV